MAGNKTARPGQHIEGFTGVCIKRPEILLRGRSGACGTGIEGNKTARPGRGLAEPE